MPSVRALTNQSADHALIIGSDSSPCSGYDGFIPLSKNHHVDEKFRGIEKLINRIQVKKPSRSYRLTVPISLFRKKGTIKDVEFHSAIDELSNVRTTQQIVDPVVNPGRPDNGRLQTADRHTSFLILINYPTAEAHYCLAANQPWPGGSCNNRAIVEKKHLQRAAEILCRSAASDWHVIVTGLEHVWEHNITMQAMPRTCKSLSSPREQSPKHAIFGVRVRGQEKSHNFRIPRCGRWWQTLKYASLMNPNTIRTCCLRGEKVVFDFFFSLSLRVGLWPF